MVLWLRTGDLRLADNAAVATAVAAGASVLPVVTGAGAAVEHLCQKLVALGSGCVVRRGAHGVVEVARAVGAVEVLVCRGGDFRGLFHDVGLRVRVCGVGGLWDAPRWMPPLPVGVAGLLEVPGGTGSNGGEDAAWEKLRSVLHGLRLSFVVRREWGARALHAMRSEVDVGTLSRDRIIHEAQFAASNGPLGVARMKGAPGVSGSGIATSVASAAATAVAAMSVAAFDVNGGDRRGLEWDEGSQSFRLQEWEHSETERQMNPKERWAEFVRRRKMFFLKAFFPDDVSPDYYSFTAWRFSQRCVSATIGVFGTQALLLALGVRSGRIGQAAVVSWVLKDGLGRVGKMVWASGMGKDFDVDPKRWRFRSALLYVAGNGLEIVTQIFPASFLLFATAANSLKQVSMLTSSATRNAMYRSFGERSQNIANITAKGEAQIVVADLIGMACGIRLSKAIGTSRASVLGAYTILTGLDLVGIYMELRQVVFRTLNAERSSLLMEKFVRTGAIMTPAEISPLERILLEPRYTSRIRFSSIAKAASNPGELDVLLRVFRREHFLVSMPGGGAGRSGPCRVVLRKDASNEDVLRALLTVAYLLKSVSSKNQKAHMTLDEQKSTIRAAHQTSNKIFPSFLKGVRSSGWNTDNLLFGTLKRRGWWRHGT